MIRLAKPVIPEAALSNVIEVFKSGDLVQGRYVREFETVLQEYLNTSYSIIVSSGTAALHLCLMALGIKKGDEVIIPAFSFPATANVVEIMGAVPVPVDITLNDYCLDVSGIVSKITDRTKAIIPVHEFGQSADIEPIMQIAREYDLIVVEDAACALGTEYDGRKAGTFGNAGCLSFHPRKAVTTGEGGLIVTDDRNLADKVRALRNHGISDNSDFVYPGLNYRMTDFQAALGLAQMENIEKTIVNRIEMANSYNRFLEDCDYIRTPSIFPVRKNVYQTYHILLDERIERDKLIKDLFENGIQTNFGAHALHCLTYFKDKYGYGDTDFPVAEQAYKKGLALPIGDHLEDGDIEFIVEKLRMILDEYAGVVI